MKYRLDNEKRKSLFTYVLLLIIALITLLWGRQISEHQPNIRVWNINTWMLMLIGIPFILLQREAGLPEVWKENISNKNRFWFPFSIGLLFGALDVLVVKFIMHPEPYDTLPPFSATFSLFSLSVSFRRL